MSEASFTSDFRDHLKSLKKKYGKSFYFYKISDRFTSGIPDFFVAFRGEVAFIELKDEGKSPSDIQMFQIERLQRAGIVSVWFDNLDISIEFINEFVSKRNKELKNLLESR